jgi:N-hydroxyarylamine O-acetyltransferase
VNLRAYLDRIGYTGLLEPTFETLRAIHRAHLFAIPYENLDIHLGRALTLDPDTIHQKIVLDGRGGWCFEMNGLFAWALRELGFQVMYLAGSVNRAVLGDAAEGNHLVLRVDLNGEAYMADVGFGDGILEPIPLREGRYVQDGFHFGLEWHGEAWVFRKFEGGGPGGFEFRLNPMQLSDFALRCGWLQTAPESGFVQAIVCQKPSSRGFITLRGAVLSVMTAGGESKRTLASADEFDAVLREHFGLELAESTCLWDHVWTRHLEWLRSNPAS